MFVSNSEPKRSRALLCWLAALGALAGACDSDSVCDNGACDPVEETEAGIDETEQTEAVTESVTETEAEATDIETEEPTDPDPIETELGMTEETDLEETDIVDSGTTNTLDSGMDATAPFTPLDGGQADAGDAQVRDAETDFDCPTCCKPENNHVDCYEPTPVCDPTSGRCVECFDVDDFGCTGNTPRCKAGITVSANTCVECVSPDDCGGDTPACQQDICVPCSVADNYGCPEETPWCMAGDVPSNNSCVECIDGEDCPTGAPICENNQCIPCSLDEDAGCVQASASRCLEGAVPKENTCVECLTGDDCSEAQPFCVDNGCVECTEATHCESSDLPVCNGAGACAGCGGDDDCDRFEDLPVCDLDTGSCEECTANTDCTSANAAYCDPSTLSCSPCERNDDCSHIPGRNVCESGQCVQCTVEDESACAGNSCNPSANVCTSTAIGSRNLCESCIADSECVQGGIGNDASTRCVPMSFAGSPRPGGYCLPRQNPSCSRPYTLPFSAPSLSGVASESYCGIDQNGDVTNGNAGAVTCEAVRDLLDDVSCGNDSDCGDGEGGICGTVGGSPNKCSYTCSASARCPLSFSCDAPTTPYCN